MSNWVENIIKIKRDSLVSRLQQGGGPSRGFSKIVTLYEGPSPSSSSVEAAKLLTSRDGAWRRPEHGHGTQLELAWGSQTLDIIISSPMSCIKSHKIFFQRVSVTLEYPNNDGKCLL